MATRLKTFREPRTRHRPGSHGEDPDSGIDRYLRDRGHNIKDKQVDQSRGEETDRQSKAFEVFCCKAFSLPQEEWPGDDGPRKGAAFFIRWYGEMRGVKPYLILNPVGEYLILSPGQEAHPADVYVVGRGSVEHGFRIVGWATHQDVLARPRQSFNKNGFGLRPCIHVKDMRPLDELMNGAGKMF